MHAKPGYAGWKGVLLSLAVDDPAFQRFLKPDVPSRIRLDEVVWGGVKVDGIPALEQPAVIPAADARYLEDDEFVAAASLGGEQRAWPLRIIDWHEMVNDVVGGEPITLSY